MSVIGLYHRSAQRRLDLLRDELQEEHWKTAHREAGGCNFLELVLGSILDVFPYIQELERTWRSEIYRGVEQSTDRLENFVKDLFVRWLELAQVVLTEVIDFEQRGYQVERAAEFRQMLASIEQLLADWVPPLPAQSPVMRVEPVAEEEADELRAILNAPAGSLGKLNTNPLVLPEGNPSMLR